MVVLHELQKWLIRSGKDAIVMHLDDPRAIEDDDIVVYPGTIPGNPLQAKRVVRYILDEPGNLGGDKEYDSSEILVASTESLSGYSHGVFLEVPITEEFFTDRGHARTINCFWVGRGKNTNHPATTGCTEITWQWPANRRELAELLNRTRILYSYDDKTQLLTEAMLCGCSVKIIRDNVRVDPAQPAPPGPEAFMKQLEQFIQLTWYPEINPVPDIARRLHERGLQLKTEQRYAEALNCFQSAGKEGDTSIHAHIGDCLANLENYTAAETVYHDALAYDLTDIHANAGLGVLKLLAGEAAPAIAAFSKVLKIDPDNSKALCGLGMARLLEGRTQIGFGYLIKACRADPENITALTELLKAAYRLCRFEDANECLQRYLMFHPGDIDMLYAHAGLLYRMGKYSDALDVVDRFLVLDPSFQGGHELRDILVVSLASPTEKLPAPPLCQAAMPLKEELHRNPPPPTTG
jgi:tetratricopeptide (TPR) repeat protein